MNQSDHEDSLIKSFIISGKRDRMLSLLCNPKKRQKALNELYHFHALDDRFVELIAKHNHSPQGIAETLRKYGSPDTCWVMSTDDTLDGREMHLEEALIAIVGNGEGSMISCVPGKLAFYEGEEPEDRYILRRLIDH